MKNEYRRYVALGDSSTEGIEDPDGRGGYRGWADRLAEHLAVAFGRVEYANLAVRGRVSHEIRATQLEPALTLEPDLATVFGGMNDLLRPSFDPAATAGHLEAMFGALADSGATVVTLTLPDPTPINAFARLMRKRFVTLNELIRAAATRTGTVVVDLWDHPIASDPRLWCEDRLHGNTEGHTRVAAAIARVLALPGSDDSWAEPLPPQPRRRPLAAVSEEVVWARKHLVPWVGRRVRGQSSGDGVEAKRPTLLPVEIVEARNV